VLGQAVEKQQYPGMTFAVLPHENGSVSGCLTPSCNGSADNHPSAQGPLLYFNCQGRLDQSIAAVESNGGKILQPKHQIGAHGYRALVFDSEGNRIALHSM
jgi:predicted enzyme related to lactoylglutathione lyase